MAIRKFETVRELIYWSYANLAMAHTAVDKKQGFVLPVGVQFTPLEKLDRFSLHIELQPTLDIEGDLILQSSWGLRYKFGKKE